MADIPTIIAIIESLKADQRDDEKTHYGKVEKLFERMNISYRMIKCPYRNCLTCPYKCGNDVPAAGPFPSEKAACETRAVLNAHGFRTVSRKGFRCFLLLSPPLDRTPSLLKGGVPIATR